MKLKIIEFINQHANWRELLSQPPYHITIEDDGHYTILKYSQIDSDFNEPIVRECRGLIIRNDNFQPVCVPFFKFGNYGESYCPEIDWQSARVQEKLDGSLIKCWFDGDWHVSTNGTIDSHKARVGDTDISFNHLFCKTYIEVNGTPLHTLDKNCTYLFELCCPENRVVVPHTKAKLYHIGTRNNRTLEEMDVDIGMEKPKEYNFLSIEECIEAAKALPFCEEGYVVVDKHWNRIKIKSPAYVAAFHLKNNGVITTTRIIDLIRTGEVKEFLTYYPEYTDDISDVEDAIQKLESRLNCRVADLTKQEFPTQKDFALAVKDDRFSAFYFEWRKKGILPGEWLEKIQSWKLTEYLESVD